MVRSDVRRNNERLLAAAHEVFTAEGADASMAEVARRAGVGVATLYRHFPTRESLLEALLSERYDALAALAHDLMNQPPTSKALVIWLEAFIDHITAFRGAAAAAMAALSDETTTVHHSCHAMRQEAAALFTRAQQAGQLAPDLAFRTLLRLANAIAIASEDSPHDRAALLHLAMTGAVARA